MAKVKRQSGSSNWAIIGRGFIISVIQSTNTLSIRGYFGYDKCYLIKELEQVFNHREFNSYSFKIRAPVETVRSFLRLIAEVGH